MRKNSSYSSKDKRPGSNSSFKKSDGQRHDKDARPFKKKYDGSTKSGSSEGKPFRSSKPYSSRATGSDKRDDKDARPFKKKYDGNTESRPSDREKPFRTSKPYAGRVADGDKRQDKDARPFKKKYDGNTGSGRPEGDKPFRSSKPYSSRTTDSDKRQDKDARPFKKKYEGNTDSASSEGSKPYRSSKPYSGRITDGGNRFDKDAKPFKKKYDGNADSAAPRGDKPYRSSKPYSGRVPGGEKPDRPFDKPSFKDKKHKDGDRPFRKPEDSRPFRKREQPSFGKKGFEKRDISKEEIRDSEPEVQAPKFSDVVKNAFHGTDAKDKIKKDDQHAKREEFEDKVYGELDEVKTNVKKPYERAENTATGKRKHVHAEGRKKKYKDDDEDDDDIEVNKTNPEMPLNKFIAHSGECSRRDAAELVKQGKVKVNGELVMDPGYRVKKEDNVTMSGKKLTPQRGFVYLLLNKPKGYITTNEDPQGRKTVMELVSNAEADRLYPVGRLDRETSGLLLITNDGDLTQKLSHPSYDIKKVYHVTLDKPLTKADFEKIVAGVDLEDGKAIVDEIAYLETKNELGLEIHSGKNRIVRRIFESLGYVVEKLDRMMYAGLTKKNLPRGKWRKLTDREVVLLKHFKTP